MLLRKNISKRVSIISLVIVGLLAACGTSSTSHTSPTINLTDVNSTAQSAAVTLFAQTLAPTSTATMVPTNTPKPTPTPLPFMPLEGLRVAYITSDGNLYIQDSGKPAIQLTSNVANRRPIFSDDGQKIVFYRAVGELWIIGADGTGERAIITLELLRAFGEKYDEFTGLASAAFIPGTHNLIFNTGFDQRTGESHPHSNKDLLFVNADTGEIRQLRAPDQGGNYLASPDGKKIAVQTIDHVDVIDVQGKLLLGNLVARPPIDEYYGISWAEMFWTPDSNELIILPSRTDPAAAGIPVLRMVWRFPLSGGGQGVEIKLDPTPSYNEFSISPDGNWIIYAYTAPEVVIWDSEKPVGIYLGNLHDGTAKLVYKSRVNEIKLPSFYHSWSPDGMHFAFEDDYYHLYFGNTQGEITPARPGDFIGWIDNTHYLFHRYSFGEIDKEQYVNVIEYPLDITLATHIFLGH